MPIIAVFFGLIIRVYHHDHSPPHIHAQYGEFEAILEIATGKVLYGKVPVKALRLLNEWMKRNRADIMKAWDDASRHKSPRRVKPLE